MWELKTIQAFLYFQECCYGRRQKINGKEVRYGPGTREALHTNGNEPVERKKTVCGSAKSLLEDPGP